MIGGVLVERTVKEVSPALESNREKVRGFLFALNFLCQKNSFWFQISTLVETLQKQLSDKGAEINGYIEKHNIQVRGGPKKDEADKASASASDSATKGSSGVLVSESKASWFNCEPIIVQLLITHFLRADN